MTDRPAGNDLSPLRLAAIVFISSFVILFVEMVEPKLFQFLKVFGHEMGVMSLAMLGLGFAGLAGVSPRWTTPRAVSLAALALGPAVALSFFVSVLLPNQALAVLTGFGHFPAAALVALVCALPYFCAGLITVAAYLRHSSFRVYALTMSGSGSGIVATHFFLPRLGAEGSILAAAVLAAAAAALLPVAGQGRARRAAAVSLVVGLVLLGLQLGGNYFDLLRLAPRHPQAARLAQPGQFASEAIRTPGARVLATRWSAISRVDVLSTPRLSLEQLVYPAGVRAVDNPLIRDDLRESFQTTTHLYANNVWFSSLPDKVPLRSSLVPYSLLSRPRVLVIGVGGGIDLARALALDPQRLVGVEINPALVELMQSGQLPGPLSEAYRRADVQLMDGRSFAHFSPERFDLINLVFADLYIPFHNSNIFMESYLYTVEGFEDYLKLLNPGGYLAVTKMVGSLQSPTELMRITATALAAARRKGFDRPADNIVVIGFSSGRPDAHGGTMLLKNGPWTGPELDEVRSELKPPLFPLYLPGEPGRDNPFARLITAADLPAFIDSYPLNINPTTDNQPFFYLFDRRFAIHRNIVLFFLAITLAAFWAPAGVIAFRRGPARAPGFAPATAAVVLLAMGYIFIESSLVQKLNLYLGGPLYSLSLVTAAFLVYPAIGGLIASRLPAARSAYALILPALVLAAYEPALAAIAGALPFFPPLSRMAVFFLLLAPLALPLGLPFPRIMEGIKTAAGPAAAGLLFGANAIAAVVMVSLSLYWSARFGINSLFFAGAAAYFAVFPAVLLMDRQTRAQAKP